MIAIPCVAVIGFILNWFLIQRGFRSSIHRYKWPHPLCVENIVQTTQSLCLHSLLALTLVYPIFTVGLISTGRLCAHHLPFWLRWLQVELILLLYMVVSVPNPENKIVQEVLFSYGLYCTKTILQDLYTLSLWYSCFQTKCYVQAQVRKQSKLCRMWMMIRIVHTVLLDCIVVPWMVYSHFNSISLCAIVIGVSLYQIKKNMIF